MLNPNEPCPCGSGKILKLCCLPDESPIVERNDGFKNITINSNLVDAWDNEVLALMGMKTHMSLRKPNQLTEQIENLLTDFMHRLAKTNQMFTNETGLYLENLRDSLYAVHYHKKQFLFRLRLLELEEALSYRPIEGNVIIELDDMPLKFELAAYVSQVITTLDALAKVVNSHLKLFKKKATNGNVYKFFVDNHHIKKNEVQQLREVYFKNEPWISHMKELRNEIQHNAELSDFRSFEYEKGSVTQPKLGERHSNYMVFQIWRNLMNFINEVFVVLFS